MNIVELGPEVSLERNLEQSTEKERETVGAIVAKIREKGDDGLRELTELYDGARLDSFFVTPQEMEEAYRDFSDKSLKALRRAMANIRSFHEKQIRQSWITTQEDGTMLGQKITPLDRAGVYVPGGKAAYPSTIMMNVIPAQTAGVEDIVMTSPPDADGKLTPGVLVTAAELGVSRILKAGGAQAVAALAYGTETVPRVDKITGPGNIFVALAKREVFGQVDIDMIAGPSEIVVLADETTSPDLAAADLISQAEHDEMSSAVLVTTSRYVAEQTKAEVDKQLETLPKKDIAAASLCHHGAIYLADSMTQAVEAVNQLAGEHLELLVEDPHALLGRIRHAGAIFLGPYSSEPVGDYMAGPNHVLPTNGTARFSSPLSVDDFTKKSSIISYSRTALEDHAGDIAQIARLEGLEGHARAVERRGKGENG
ncbi:histidinol dehydrogenase [Salibacterium halotolerans]|uniref:Histidinol dehydrogenase n=1 Tax=Salibacterium halotolerans TaxID=1884432 RepID=A0A1I5VRJ7_9BACI|nr:histidinol dehydrogenase [Salibacterium halotolerans]SFQ10105.1 histidinol dehydrogenase [Salibacterium halotolerans]